MITLVTSMIAVLDTAATNFVHVENYDSTELTVTTTSSSNNCIYIDASLEIIQEGWSESRVFDTVHRQKTQRTRKRRCGKPAFARRPRDGL